MQSAGLNKESAVLYTSHISFQICGLKDFGLEIKIFANMKILTKNLVD